MLRIRQEQLDALNRDAHVQFVERIADDLAGSQPHLGRDARMALVRGAIEKADRYGIDEEADVRQYLDWMLRHGESFDTAKAFSWALTILKDDSLDGSAKMHELTLAEAERAGDAS